MALNVCGEVVGGGKFCVFVSVCVVIVVVVVDVDVKGCLGNDVKANVACDVFNVVLFIIFVSPNTQGVY